MHLSSPSDNFTETQDSRKARFTRVTEVVESCQMCWISNGMQHICNTNINDMYRTFSEKSGNVFFLRVPTSGVAVSEYFELMLASIEKYLLSDIVHQRDMSKIALQSANDRLELNSIFSVKETVQWEIKASNRTGTVDQMDANIEAMARDLQEILRIGTEQKRLWDVYEGR